jgi:hypothetical protein
MSKSIIITFSIILALGVGFSIGLIIGGKSTKTNSNIPYSNLEKYSGTIYNKTTGTLFVHITTKHKNYEDYDFFEELPYQGNLDVSLLEGTRYIRFEDADGKSWTRGLVGYNWYHNENIEYILLSIPPRYEVKIHPKDGWTLTLTDEEVDYNPSL